MRYIFILFCCSCSAATWYAASNGSNTNGTSALPWSIPYATTNTNPYLSDGDVVLLKNGTFTSHNYYPDPYTISNSFMLYASGVTYQSENLWGFTFDCGVIVPYSTSNVTFKNLRVNIAELEVRNKTNAWEMPSGMSLYGSNCVVLHCLIENCGQPGIFSGNESLSKNITGNIIRFVGYNDWSLTGGVQYSNAPRGEGLYIENLDTPAVLGGNVIYYTATGGILCKNGVEDFRLTNNILSTLDRTGVLLQQKHDPVEAFTAVSNYVWRASVGSTFGNDLYDDGWNGTNALIVGNYFVGNLKGVSFFGHFQEMRFQSNTVVQLGKYGDGYNDQATEYNIAEFEETPITNALNLTFSGNTYIASNSTAWLFSTTNTAGWNVFTNTTGDVTSTCATNLPSSLVSYAFSPSTDSNFLHVAVFNWPTNSTTTVDLSSYFASGSRLAIYDAQNIPTAYTNITYSGGDVSLDLTLTNAATMLGTFSQRTDTWEGFDPRFRAFVIYQQPQTANLTVTGNLFIGP